MIESDDGRGEGGLEVVDEEGLVDRERKQMILETRRDVRKWKKELYMRIDVGDSDIDRPTANRIWGERVREYLLTIEPLLREGELPHVEGVYTETQIGTVEIEPPEELVEASGRPDPVEAKDRDIVAFGTNPESKEVSITGLRDVIEREAVTAKWEVSVRQRKRRGQPMLPSGDRTFSVSKHLPQRVLLDAVRLADHWLQKADIGIEVDTDREWEV